MIFVMLNGCPRKGPPSYLTDGRRSMTKSALAFVYCV